MRNLYLLQNASILDETFTGFSMRHLRVDPALGIWSVQQRFRSLAYI